MSIYNESAKKLAEIIMQDASFKLSDVINGYPPETRVLVLVVMRRLVDTVKPMMPESDQDLFDRLLSRTNVITAPTALDPRKQEGDG